MSTTNDFLHTAHLFLTEDEVVELLLEYLVRVVDQELFEEILGENLESEYIE